LLTTFFLSQLIPPPLRPTLFPYTTLFRSWHPEPRAGVPGIRSSRSTSPSASRSPSETCCREAARRRPLGRVSRRARARRVVGLGDRKSTRLNSSHVKISYAVFCLKKKRET